MFPAETSTPPYWRHHNASVQNLFSLWRCIGKVGGVEIPAITVFQPQLPGQTAATPFQSQLAAKTRRRGLIELGDVVNRGSIPGEHLLTKPGRQVAAQLINRHAYWHEKSSTRSPTSSRLI